MLDQGMTPEKMLETLLDGMDIEFTDTMPVQFYCNCSKEKVEKAFISIGKKELEAMIADEKEIEVNCHFCNHNYFVSSFHFTNHLYFVQSPFGYRKIKNTAIFLQRSLYINNV